jgi:RNA polymerase sigma-70 factor (ECF subfamily)
MGRPGGMKSDFADLYTRSGAARFSLSFADFADILREIAARYLPSDARADEIADLLQSLRLDDLALARACAAGNEAAWECFLERYRHKLHRAARAIAHDEETARELADSLYTDLYGTRENEDGRRVSKLASYTGRGSLDGWLRTVLAQEYVNRCRRERRMVELDEQRTAQSAASVAAHIDPRLEHATDQALESLSGEERFILVRWFLDGRTLAEVARIFGVHESTVSRRVDKITAALRKRIVRGLRERGMSARQAEEALDADVRDLAVDVRGRLGAVGAKSND